MRLLPSDWERAKAGEGQVVLLLGEPGVGKSRLTAEFLKRVDAEPQLRFRCYCSPQCRDSALHPIIGLIERAAGFTPDDDQKARLDKLDAFLARTATSPGTRRCSPTCCRFETTAAIRPRHSAATTAAAMMRAMVGQIEVASRQAAADGRRGRALGRSDDSGVAGSAGRQDRGPSSAASRHYIGRR